VSSPSTRFGSRENLHLIERWDAHRAKDPCVRGPDRRSDRVDPTMDHQAGVHPAEREENRIYYEPRCIEGNYGLLDCCMDGGWKSAPSRRDAAPIREPTTASAPSCQFSRIVAVALHPGFVKFETPGDRFRRAQPSTAPGSPARPEKELRSARPVHQGGTDASNEHSRSDGNHCSQCLTGVAGQGERTGRHRLRRRPHHRGRRPRPRQTRRWS